MTWLHRNSWKIAAVVMAVTFLLTAAIAMHAGPVLRYQDEKDYILLAKNLVALHHFSMDGVHPTASRPPGYIWFLALPQLLHVSNTGVRIYNAIALTACQVFLFLLAERMASKTVAVLAVLLSLIYPVFFYTASVLFPQTFGAALLLCTLWLLLGKQPLGTGKAMAAGVTGAALILTIPTFLMVGGVLTVWLCWRRKDFRRSLLAFLAPMVILLGGWSARNYVAFHSFVFVATNGGINLLLGNSEHITGYSGSSANVSKYTDVGHHMSEVEQNKYYSSSAKLWIKEHPKQAALLYRDKFLHYFWFFDRTTAEDQSSALAEQKSRLVIMALTYGPLLLLLLLRLALVIQLPMTEEEVCLVGLYLCNAIFTAIFFPRIRFRLPMDWLLLILDASTLYLLAFRLLGGGRIKAKSTLQLDHSTEDSLKIMSV